MAKGGQNNSGRGKVTVRRGIESAVKTKWLRPIGRGKGFELEGSKNKMPIYNKNNICAELPNPSHAPDAPSGPPPEPQHRCD